MKFGYKDGGLGGKKGCEAFWLQRTEDEPEDESNVENHRVKTQLKEKTNE